MTSSAFGSLARTSVDRARVGALTTYARHPSSQSTSSVAVRARTDGTVEVELGRDATATRQLLARPVASLRVAPEGCEPVLLHGAARRLPGTGERGTLVFHLQVAAARVGSPPVLLDGTAYAEAAPDPLRHAAPAALAHLNDAHADALAACLRATGHDAAFAHATRLDSGGLTVLAVTQDGADTVCLRFASPVTTLTGLPTSLRCALSPGCGCTHTRP